jgi:hypothetical protein
MHSLKVFGAEELDRSKISQNSKKISTGVEALGPIWHKDDPEPDEIELLKNFSLFDSLPPNLESLHFTDLCGFLDKLQWIPLPLSTFYKLLEDVALAKERGPLRKLVSITMHTVSNQKYLFSEEDTRGVGVATICERLRIEWEYMYEWRSMYEGRTSELKAPAFKIPEWYRPFKESLDWYPWGIPPTRDHHGGATDEGEDEEEDDHEDR